MSEIAGERVCSERETGLGKIICKLENHFTFNLPTAYHKNTHKKRLFKESF